MRQKINTSLDNFELPSGEIVYGKQLEDKVLYAEEGPERQVFLSDFERKTNLTSFGKNSLNSKTLTNNLQGIFNFSINNPIMGIYTTFNKLGHIQIYTLFQTQDEHINAEGIRLMNSQVDPFYLEQTPIPLSSNLASENYFFESRRFIKGDEALEEFDRIKNNVGFKRRSFN